MASLLFLIGLILVGAGALAVAARRVRPTAEAWSWVGAGLGLLGLRVWSESAAYALNLEISGIERALGALSMAALACGAGGAATGSSGQAGGEPAPQRWPTPASEASAQRGGQPGRTGQPGAAGFKMKLERRDLARILYMQTLDWLIINLH